MLPLSSLFRQCCLKRWNILDFSSLRLNTSTPLLASHIQPGEADVLSGASVTIYVNLPTKTCPHHISSKSVYLSDSRNHQLLIPAPALLFNHTFEFVENFFFALAEETADHDMETGALESRLATTESLCGTASSNKLHLANRLHQTDNTRQM